MEQSVEAHGQIRLNRAEVRLARGPDHERPQGDEEGAENREQTGPGRVISQGRHRRHHQE